MASVWGPKSASNGSTTGGGVPAGGPCRWSSGAGRRSARATGGAARLLCSVGLGWGAFVSVRCDGLGIRARATGSMRASRAAFSRLARSSPTAPATSGCATRSAAFHARVIVTSSASNSMPSSSYGSNGSGLGMATKIDAARAYGMPDDELHGQERAYAPRGSMVARSGCPARSRKEPPVSKRIGLAIAVVAMIVVAVSAASSREVAHSLTAQSPVCGATQDTPAS